MDLFVRPATMLQKKQEVLHALYRSELKKLIPELLEKWRPILGVTISAWGIKRMKTKWGTCSGLIWSWPRSRSSAGNTSWCMN